MDLKDTLTTLENAINLYQFNNIVITVSNDFNPRERIEMASEVSI